MATTRNHICYPPFFNVGFASGAPASILVISFSGLRILRSVVCGLLQVQ
jgi:hypothetical protein